MKSANEFWLCLHALFRAYEAEGSSPPERAEAIVARFLKMPSIARQEALESFWPLVQHLPDVYQSVATAHSRMEATEEQEEPAHRRAKRPR
jgi:hypothetical protein